ncbi:CCC motif membrane protein [Formosa sp. A9]|uniref:CCC motif membrane protein n=1 Tax=Formosa sp. A9 TaxID=3442641 RepID=UPI003EB9DB6A
MEKIKLNTTPIYILTAVGFICCCGSGLGVIFAGIAYYMAYSKLKEAALNPENYENIQGMNTAKTVALVVLIINAIYLIYSIYYISSVGIDNIMEQQREILEQWNIEQPV